MNVAFIENDGLCSMEHGARSNEYAELSLRGESSIANSRAISISITQHTQDHKKTIEYSDKHAKFTPLIISLPRLRLRPRLSTGDNQGSTQNSLTSAFWQKLRYKYI